jgi:hypothetical protein
MVTESLGQSKSRAEAKLEADEMKVEVDGLERTYRERNEDWASARGAAIRWSDAKGAYDLAGATTRVGFGPYRHSPGRRFDPRGGLRGAVGESAGLGRRLGERRE